jgi:hypothetical protein
MWAGYDDFWAKGEDQEMELLGDQSVPVQGYNDVWELGIGIQRYVAIRSIY